MRGDGDGEHPTQALLDLFTIAERFPGRRDLRVTFVGDLLKGADGAFARLSRGGHAGRTAVAGLRGRGRISSPPEIDADPGPPLRGWCATAACHAAMHEGLSPALVAESDVIYMTRTQSERHEVAARRRGLRAHRNARRRAAPRRDRPAPAAPQYASFRRPSTACPQARYFQQARNGLFVRMAILLWVFGLLDSTPAEVDERERGARLCLSRAPEWRMSGGRSEIHERGRDVQDPRRRRAVPRRPHHRGQSGLGHRPAARGEFGHHVLDRRYKRGLAQRARPAECGASTGTARRCPGIAERVHGAGKRLRVSVAGFSVEDYRVRWSPGFRNSTSTASRST